MKFLGVKIERMNRITYLANSILGTVLIMVTGLILGVLFNLNGGGEPHAFFIITSIVLTYFYLIIVGVNRLHDMGLSGWWLVLSLVPIAGFALSLALLFGSGNDKKNRYGSKPKAYKIFGYTFARPA